MNKKLGISVMSAILGVSIASPVYALSSYTAGGLTGTTFGLSTPQGSNGSHTTITYTGSGGMRSGNTGTVLMNDDPSSESFSCGSERFTNGQGILMQGGHAHISITNVKVFVATYGQDLFDKIMASPTMDIANHTIHSYNGPCGINWTVDEAIVPPPKYNITVKLIEPWNVKQGHSSLTPDSTGQNLNDQYCPDGAPVLQATKVSSTQWKIKNSSSYTTINFGCAGLYEVIATNSYGVTVEDIKHPVFPSFLPIPPTPSNDKKGGKNPSGGKSSGGSGVSLPTPSPNPPTCTGAGCTSSGGVSLPPSSSTGNGSGTVIITQ